MKALAKEAARVAPPDYSGGGGWVEALVQGCDDPRLGVPASWLLLEHGKGARKDALTEGQVRALGKRLAGVSEPHAQLHLCQIVRFLEVPAESAGAFGAFLTAALSSPRPFVRAWAMDGLQRLARQHGEFQGAAEGAMEAGAEDPAASVRARVRRILAGD